MNEHDLITQLIQKNEHAITEFLNRYTPLMRYIIAPILPGAHDMEDCISEISIKIWKKIELYDPERGNFTSWITAITRNTALNYKRKLLSQISEEIPEGTPSKEPTPEEAALRREQLKEVQRAILSLSSIEKQLFYRKYYYFQPLSQISSEMHMSERAVEGKLYRLKKKLRKMLGGEANE